MNLNNKRGEWGKCISSAFEEYNSTTISHLLLSAESLSLFSSPLELLKMPGTHNLLQGSSVVFFFFRIKIECQLILEIFFFLFTISGLLSLRKNRYLMKNWCETLRIFASTTYGIINLPFIRYLCIKIFMSFKFKVTIGETEKWINGTLESLFIVFIHTYIQLEFIIRVHFAVSNFLFIFCVSVACRRATDTQWMNKWKNEKDHHHRRIDEQQSGTCRCTHALYSTLVSASIMPGWQCESDESPWHKQSHRCATSYWFQRAFIKRCNSHTLYNVSSKQRVLPSYTHSLSFMMKAQVFVLRFKINKRLFLLKNVWVYWTWECYTYSAGYRLCLYM